MRGVRRSIIRFWKALQDGGKILLASFIGVMSLVVNFYMVWTAADWSGRPYYELFKEVITVTAATAAVLITIVIYSPEVVKVFGETFLAKRHAAGREEGLEEGRVEGRAEGRVEGRVEGRAEGRVEGQAEGRVEERSDLLKFIGENPGATAEQVEAWARNRDSRRNGDGGGKGRRD